MNIEDTEQLNEDAWGEERTSPVAALREWYAGIEIYHSWLKFLHLGALLILVASFEALPMQDYPDWLYQGYIFNQYVFHGNNFGGAYTMHPYLPPNMISTIIIGTLSEIVQPAVAGKIFLFLEMLAVYFGIYLFMGITLKDRKMLRAAIAFTFVFSYNFWLGNINFVMGLGVALLGAYLLIGRRWIEKPLLSMGVVLLCYSCHFFSLAVLGFASLAYIISERRTDLIWKLLLAALPAAALFVHYLLNAAVATGDENITLSLFQNLRERAAMFAGVIIPFQRFHYVTEPNLFHKIGNYTYLGAIALMMIIAAREILRNGVRNLAKGNMNGLLAVILLPLIFLLPLYTSGIVYPGERLVVFFLVNMLAFLVATRPNLATLLLPLFIAMNIAVCGYAYHNTSRWSGRDPLICGQFELIPDAAETQGGGGIDPYSRKVYYEVIPGSSREIQQAARPLPIFKSGMFDHNVPDSLFRAKP